MAATETSSIVAPEELERDGKWILVRRSLGCTALGLNIVEIPAGESIPEHDETERDQEEVFHLVSGEAELVLDGAPHSLPQGGFARVAPRVRRTVRNTGADTARVLIVSAPTTSGYEPMGWA
jgi:glyoxylate utilization-related uncharacterized protein